MKRNENYRENRGISLFSHIRLDLHTIHTEDEFFRSMPTETEVRPDYFRWFCGMHDLEETYICRAL